MRKLTLSDYISEQLMKSEKLRQDDYDRRTEAFKDKLYAINEQCRRERDAYKAFVSLGKVLIQLSWKTKSFRYFIFSIKIRAWAALMSKTTQPTVLTPPKKQHDDDQDRRWRDGLKGETAVDSRLDAILEDDWTLISGYRNRGGEIDRILVGTTGVFAIEIKNVIGHISCRRDIWKRTFYTKRNQLLNKLFPIRDKNGRSPSQQLNSASRQLERHLCRSYPSLRIVRLIIFTHEGSEFGNIVNSTVDEVLLLSKWDPTVTLSRLNLAFRDADVPKLVKLIEEGHNNFNNRKTCRRRTANRRQKRRGTEAA